MPATSTTKLRYTFKDSSDESFYIYFSHVDDEAESTDVAALGNGIVTNKLLWERSPVSLEAAAFVTNTITPVSLN